MSKTTNTKITQDMPEAIIFGQNSFMPSGLLQWIIFAVLILIVILLVRKVFGLSDKYFSTPLKHD